MEPQKPQGQMMLIVGVVVAAILVIGAVLAFRNVSQTPMTDTNPATASLNSGDPSLDQDSQSVDSDLNQIDSELNGVDQGLNDKQGDLSVQ